MNDRNRLIWILALGHGATHWHQGAMSVCLPLILKDPDGINPVRSADCDDG